MSTYSVALPRCPFFFKRRMYSKAKGIAPDDWQFVSYRSADAKAVTHITALALFSVCVGWATAFELPVRHVFVCGKSLMPGNGFLVWPVKIRQRSSL